MVVEGVDDDNALKLQLKMVLLEPPGQDGERWPGLWGGSTPRSAGPTSPHAPNLTRPSWPRGRRVGIASNAAALAHPMCYANRLAGAEPYERRRMPRTTATIQPTRATDKEAMAMVSGVAKNCTRPPFPCSRTTRPRSGTRARAEGL